MEWSISSRNQLLWTITIGGLIFWWFFVRNNSTKKVALSDPAFADMDLLNKAKKLSEQVKVNIEHVNIKVADQSFNVYYLDAKPPKGDVKANILLLHGIASNSDGTADVWKDVSTLEIFTAAGYHVVAPDLPGTAMSRTKKERMDEGKKYQFVKEFMAQVKLEKAIIFGASWGGTFSIPLLVKHPDLFRAFVAVAPVSSGLYSAKDYNEIKVPTLIIYGESDVALGETSYENLKSLPNSKRVVVHGVGHRVFQEMPEQFHAACLNYMNSILS